MAGTGAEVSLIRKTLKCSCLLTVGRSIDRSRKAEKLDFRAETKIDNIVCYWVHKYVYGRWIWSSVGESFLVKAWERRKEKGQGQSGEKLFLPFPRSQTLDFYYFVNKSDYYFFSTVCLTVGVLGGRITGATHKNRLMNRSVDLNRSCTKTNRSGAKP